MAVCYNKLFELLIDKKMINTELANKPGFGTNVLTRLKRDCYVLLDSIERICSVFSCGVDDTLEFVPGTVNIKGYERKKCCYDE